jgi:hypothetical protein
VGLKGWIVAVTTLVVAVTALLTEVHKLWPPDSTSAVTRDGQGNAGAAKDAPNPPGEGQSSNPSAAQVVRERLAKKAADEQRIAEEKIDADKLAAKAKAEKEAKDRELALLAQKALKLDNAYKALNDAYDKISGDSWLWSERWTKTLFKDRYIGECVIVTERERRLRFTATSIEHLKILGEFDDTERLEADYTPSSIAGLDNSTSESNCNRAATGDMYLAKRVLKKSGSVSAAQDKDEIDIFSVTTDVTGCSLNAESCPRSEYQGDDYGEFQIADGDELKIGDDQYQRR